MLFFCILTDKKGRKNFVKPFKTVTLHAKFIFKL